MLEIGNRIGVHSSRSTNTEQLSWEENKFNEGNSYYKNGSW